MATRKVKVAEPKTAEPKTAKPLPSTHLYAADSKIVVLVENPGRAGTKRHAWFELYSKCKTVGKYLEAGGGRGYLTADVSDGYIEIK